MIGQAGFVKLPRALVHWEWYTELNTCKLFLHCLIKANYSTKKWQGITVRKNEFITSIEKLAVETGLTPSKVRTSLKKLASTDDLKIESNTKYTKIVITSNLIVEKPTKLSVTELNDKQDDKQLDMLLINDSQANNNQIATTKKEKEEDIKKRKKTFRDKVFLHSNFNNKNLQSFFDYWSELNTDKTKMRFETERFFEIEKRLKKWLANERINHKTQTVLQTNRNSL